MQGHLSKRHRSCSCLFIIKFEHVFAYFAIPLFPSCLVLSNNTFIKQNSIDLEELGLTLS